MCGICGIVKNSPLSEADSTLLGDMNRTLHHRGPDSEGFFKNANVAIAMRRLKIIDLAGGDQPLFNEDGTIALVANGEIYNHVELREELEKKGHRFKTRSDCETIIHLYEDYGVESLHKLRGMFAFALYDKRSRRLFIARDRLGEKPLYYYKTDSEFVFSSEMKSLLVYLRRGDVKINRDSVNMYFHYQYVPEPLTCIEGVCKLPAAHYISMGLDDFSFELKKYWDIEDAEPVEGNPVELIRNSFDELSRLIIRADVPVGISLSGGIDSGAIACFAAKHYRERMHAFSVGYHGKPANDERAMAKGLAEKLGLAYHEMELKTEDLTSAFPELVRSMDDPIADIAAFGYYSVSRLAKENGIPVLLHGLGGDELFWGYEWVRNAVDINLKRKKLLSINRLHALFLLADEAFKTVKKKDLVLNPSVSFRHVFGHFKGEKAKFLKYPERYILYDEIPDFTAAFSHKKGLYTEEFVQAVDDESAFSFFSDESRDEIPIKVCKFLYHVWLYSNCIALGDRMSMAWSIENRLPFLDYRFIELVMGLRKTRDDYKLGSKRWFIEAMKGIVPNEVLERKKRGFTPPSAEWYRAIVGAYGRLCLDGYLVSSGVLRRDGVTDFINGALDGRRNLFFAYKIAFLEMWCRLFIMGERHA